MNEYDPNDFEATDPNAQHESRGSGREPADSYQPVERPYGDAGNLYEIPRVRSDDPPMRHWWSVDEEPQQDDSDSQNR